MLFAFPLKVDIQKDPQNLQMELINLQCDTNLNQKFAETKLQDFYSYIKTLYFYGSVRPSGRVENRVVRWRLIRVL
jgi:hypothetical protein